MELTLTKPEDLKKLEGLHIEKVSLELRGNSPVLILELTHVAAECPVKLEIMPTVQFGRSGNIFIINEQLKLHLEDIRR